MDERADQIEKHLRRQRDELKDNFNELGRKGKDTFNWRTQFQQRTGVMLGIAFGGGILLSALFRGHCSRTTYDGSNSSHDDRIHATRAEGRNVARDTKGSEGWQNMKGALVGVAVTKLGGYIEELLPGFQSEYER